MPACLAAGRSSSDLQNSGFQLRGTQGERAVRGSGGEKKYLEIPPPSPRTTCRISPGLSGFLKLQHDEHKTWRRTCRVIRKFRTSSGRDDFRIVDGHASVRPCGGDGKTRIQSMSRAGDTSRRSYAIAIGHRHPTRSTGRSSNLITGKVLSEHGEFNGQISYGEDVITRIVVSEKPGGSIGFKGRSSGPSTRFWQDHQVARQWIRRTIVHHQPSRRNTTYDPASCLKVNAR